MELGKPCLQQYSVMAFVMALAVIFLRGKASANLENKSTITRADVNPSEDVGRQAISMHRISPGTSGTIFEAW